jgi:arylsulfatase A-like enzyme
MIYPQYGRPGYMSEAEMRDAKARYAGNVTLVDRWVGRFLDLAERLGLFKNTLVVWLTDHGHLFGDHDLQGKPGAELGCLYETTARIPLLIRHPDGVGAGERVDALVQPVDLFPSVLAALEIPAPEGLEGLSFWPAVSGGSLKRDMAFSNRHPEGAAGAAGQVFDGWVGSDRVVEPATVTTDRWALICAPEGMPSELYDLQSDPEQLSNVIQDHPAVAQGLRSRWIEFLRERGATEERIRPFRDGQDAAPTPREGKLFGFQDDLGQFIAFPGEEQATAMAGREGYPGPTRSVEERSFGSILEEDPKNLVFLNGQYYWAEDLA